MLEDRNEALRLELLGVHCAQNPDETLSVIQLRQQVDSLTAAAFRVQSLIGESIALEDGRRRQEEEIRRLRRRMEVVRPDGEMGQLLAANAELRSKAARLVKELLRKRAESSPPTGRTRFCAWMPRVRRDRTRSDSICFSRRELSCSTRQRERRSRRAVNWCR
jgi:hypothetical protein